MAIGFVWGLLNGDYGTALGVGVFFELFWLDQIPAGTYIPPNSVFSCFLALSVVDFFSLHTPGQVVFPILMSLPLALLGSKLEFFQRRWQDGGYNTLLHWARLPERRRNPNQPERLVLFSLLQQMGLQFALYTVCVLALVGILLFVFLEMEPFTLTEGMRWPHLWFPAALGGVLALRVKRSYVILAGGVFALALFNTL